jgi:oxygen-independent coproporphyrinogen III oxidase
VELLSGFPEPIRTLQGWGFLQQDGDLLKLTRNGLLQVDRLVKEFFLPEHRTARYA